MNLQTKKVKTSTLINGPNIFAGGTVLAHGMLFALHWCIVYSLECIFICFKTTSLCLSVSLFTCDYWVATIKMLKHQTPGFGIIIISAPLKLY